MTATPSIDPDLFLHEQLAQASPDLVRELLATFVNTLLSAQADAVCGAEYGTAKRIRRRDYPVTVGLQTLDLGCPAGRIRPRTVNEHDRRLG